MTLKTTGKTALLQGACLFLFASAASIPAKADTIAISYSNAGGLTTAPVLNGILLTLDALATGSVTSGNPALNAVWNPASFHTHDFLDVTTGLDTGTFTITFANGDTLSGNLSEVDAPSILTTNSGPFTQILNFTGGTGMFAGASGSTSGGGLVTPTGFTTAGSGTLTAAGVASPEPATAGLLLGGFLAMIAGGRRIRRKAQDRAR